MRKKLAALLVVCSAALVAGPASVAAAAGPAVVVNGGGQSTFDLFEEGTNFAIGARIGSDGSASGHFNCVIPGGVTISGNIDQGWTNSDGSVTFAGFATVQDKFFGTPPFILIKGEPFTVTFWEGGPGVGRFLYDDTVVPDPGDPMTVVTGMVHIRGT